MEAIIAAVLPLFVQLLSAIPSLVADVEQAWGLLTATTPPTAEQMAQYAAALDAAHKALQDS